MTKQTDYTVEEVYDSPDKTTYYYVHTPEFDTEPQAEKLQQQILENQKKTEKYDSLMDANHEIIHTNITHTQIHQENKQLQEKLDKIKDLLFHKTTCTNQYVLEELEKIFEKDNTLQ